MLTSSADFIKAIKNSDRTEAYRILSINVNLWKIILIGKSYYVSRCCR